MVSPVGLPLLGCPSWPQPGPGCPASLPSWLCSPMSFCNVRPGPGLRQGLSKLPAPLSLQHLLMGPSSLAGRGPELSALGLTELLAPRPVVPGAPPGCPFRPLEAWMVAGRWHGLLSRETTVGPSGCRAMGIRGGPISGLFPQCGPRWEGPRPGMRGPPSHAH